MSSTWGHFVFFLPAPKQLHAALVSSTTTSITIHCGRSKLILQMWKFLTTKKLLLVGHIDAFADVAGSVFRLFRYTPSQQKASLLTSPQKRKIPTFVLQLRKVPPGKHSVAVKQFKRERRFRLLGHIHHILVDDGALFPFMLSAQKKKPAFIKNEKNYSALYIPVHYCFPGRNLKPLTKKNP